MIANLCLRLYSAFAHVLALGAMLYLIGFMGDVLVPKTIDSGAAGPVASAMALDLTLMALFGAQHWGMRRFRGWARALPEAAERPTYLLATVAALAVMMGLWKPIPHEVWAFESEIAVYGLSLAYFAAWAVMLGGGLRGLRPCSLALSPLRARLGLRVATEASRPARRAWYVIPLITPHMTIGHLVFALGLATMVMLASILQDDEARAAALARGRAAARRTPVRKNAARGRLRALDRSGADVDEQPLPAGVTAGTMFGPDAAPRPALGPILGAARRVVFGSLAVLRGLAARNFAAPPPLSKPVRVAVPSDDRAARRSVDGIAAG